MPIDTPPIPRILGNYYLGQVLGSGYSGSIFQAQHVHTGQVVALKVQHVHHECPTNRYERRLYPALQGGKGMPVLWAAGVQGEWDYLAIDLLGKSLDNLYRKLGGVMDLGSVCSIAMQVIARLELMHARGILHRDIQLGNTVVGLPPHEETLYMIDFGFSKCYIDPYTHRHIPDSRAKRDFVGNYWFSSINVHCRGKVPSRRDDLEATALMLIHLLTPRGLAWTRNGVPKTDAAHTRLKQQKRRAAPEDLCRGLPAPFEDFLRYCRCLKFAEQPDYARWIAVFGELKVEEGYPAGEAFVWPPVAPRASAVVASPRKIRAPGVVGESAMEGILEGLKNVDLNQERPVLGERKNVEEAVRKARADVLEDATVKEEVEVSSAVGRRVPKAQRIARLTGEAGKTAENKELGRLVREFVEAMKCNSSRTLTKEGFTFVDVLCKQLGDPSVFVAPMRTSRRRSDFAENDPADMKLGVVARLKKDVAHARDNKALVEMLEDFGRVTNKSTGRTVTKDGFGFLEGLAARLVVLQ